MKILTAQLNPIVGDLKNNTHKIVKAIQRGREGHAELVLFPELALTGYPPEDLLLHPSFLDEVEESLKTIIGATQDIAVIVGLPRRSKEKGEKQLFNSAALIHNKNLLGYVDKQLLPTYDVFDERRFFNPGQKTKIWSLLGERIGITICEDAWKHSDSLLEADYDKDPIQQISMHKPTLVINLSASPYSFGKFNTRMKVFCDVSKTVGCPVVMCNQVGANDSLIFDGHSLFIQNGKITRTALGFEEDDFWIDLKDQEQQQSIHNHPLEDLYQALVLGIRDYFKKSGIQTACLGLSGGIDSALVACLAVEALGTQNVVAITMPSRYSSLESARDAKQLAEKLGMMCHELSIEEPFTSYLTALNPLCKNAISGLTQENLQARIRGMILMAFSNQFGHLVLNTGNKSEWAMGYSTLYGDMCGGIAVLGDVTKHQIYHLARWINRHDEIIPFYTIERPPSAELRDNQKDSDSLPDYEVVDKVVEIYLQTYQSPLDIAKQTGISLELVKDIIRRIHANEYKRKQAPPALRVSEKAFSVGRRFPIVQKWS